MERLLTLYSEVQSTDVRWLWYPFIAIGKITLLQGDPGDGKSTLMMNLIAELSTGGKTPDGCKIGVPQKVIYQCSEDGVSDTIKPRLERCGADCRKIACNGVQREHNKKLNNGLPILHKVPPKRDYGRYFCIMAEKGGTSHGGLTEKLSPFFHAKKQEVNAYGR